MSRRRRFFQLDEALRHPDHHRPLTRRELISQGFRAGGATMLGTSLYSLLGPRAHAISPEDRILKANLEIMRRKLESSM